MKKKKKTPVAEVERKFLMKKLPDRDLENVKFLYWKDILHFYLKGTRYTIDEYSDGRIEYVKCIKKTIPGVLGGNSEDEIKISNYEFLEAVSFDDNIEIKTIKKTRHVYDIEGIHWEFDQFDNVSLLMAEVEWIFPIDKIDMEKVNSYKVPEIIKNLVITEVTGDSGFSNFNLSTPINSQFIED